MKQIFIALLIITSACSSQNKKSSGHDPLPSWANGQLKTSMIDFVTKVSQEGGKDFIPVEDRIATFDNDGTLWAEKPVVQGIFAMEKAKEMNLKMPPKSKMTEKDFFTLVTKTHTGMTEEEFNNEVAEFFDVAKHPKFQVPLQQTIYQPQLELLHFLTDHGFTVFISSGGTIDFMRVISKKYYNIPPERVIGTNFTYKFDASTNAIDRLPKIEFINDKETKPVGIQRNIGKRPVFACGNVGNAGDVYMLRYSQGSQYSSFQLLVNHDDSEREFSYAEPDGTSLNWAQKYRWNVVNIKNDWKEVFPQQIKSN